MVQIRATLGQIVDLIRTERARHPIKGMDVYYLIDYDKGLEEQLETALTGTNEALAGYITSNDIWGGAGSICDQALLERPAESRRRC